MKKKSYLIAILLFATFITTPVLAQSNGYTGERIEQIERNLMLLQRQVSRSNGNSSSSAPADGDADFEVRLSKIEEQLRDLVGRIEKTEFQVHELSATLDKFRQDTDFRFGELTNSPVAAEAPTPTSEQKASIKQRKTPDGNLSVDGNNDSNSSSSNDVSSDVSLDDDESTLETNFSSPREHYNYAFRLLNQTQYDKAAISFSEFIKKHPKDPLIGNAYYWRGETFYIRADYARAADSFRQGFEEMPRGPKAPDNLLKLAMTLDALNRDKDACVVLSQVISKFEATSVAVSQKATQERKRIGCK
ncbi:MAG: tol-pal system protein YbgF [Rickettsiales bacterium]